MTLQLLIDGGEEPHEEVVARHQTWTQMSPTDRLIIRAARTTGIRAYQAGRIIHTLRGRCAKRTPSRPRWQRNWGTRRSTKACCYTGSSDGSAVLRRLAAKGLLARGEDGVWRTP